MVFDVPNINSGGDFVKSRYITDGERNEKEAGALPVAAVKLLIVLATTLSMTVLVANLLATKIWVCLEVPVDAGLLLFPVSYVVGDLLVEIYGKQIANYAALVAAAICIAVNFIFMVAAGLPDYPGADNTAFYSIYGVAGRIFLASVVGFVASQIVNNYTFDVVWRWQRRDSYFQRAFISSAIAHVPDILLFEPIAFFGKLSLREFFSQAIWAYITAVAVELVLMAVAAKPLAGWMTQRIGFRHGRRIK